MRLHSVVAIVAILSSASALQGREWTDSTGRYRTEAELVKREGNTVLFTDTLGHRRSIDFQRLSAADQALVVEHERQRAERVAAGKKKELIVNTLTYRQVTPVPSTDNSQLAAAANSSVFKLTGWSCCTPWYCDYPHPHPPAPPKPPLPVPSKRIYCGHWSTWHLVFPNDGNVSGSGTYLITLPNNGVVRHLVLLNNVAGPGPYLYYDAVPPLPPSGIPHWRFANSAVGSCWYIVEWSMDGTTWNFYEYCRVKLPL
jgi:type II secretory pathway pseudopilin PulG